MFRSCQYCRHRKKRCVFTSYGTGDGRCDACRHLNVHCEVEERTPSAKRQKTSQRIAAQVRLQAAANASNKTAEVATTKSTVTSQEGDCQIPRPGIEHSSKDLIINSQHQNYVGLSTGDIYNQFVKSDFPFMPANLLIAQPTPLLLVCLEVAAQMSFAHGLGLHNGKASDVDRFCGARELDLGHVAGLVLLMPRLSLSAEVTDMVMRTYLRRATIESEHDNTHLAPREGLSLLPQQLAVGIITSYTWLALSDRTSERCYVPASSLLDFAKTLDRGAFGPHLLKLTHLAASFVNLSATASNVLLTDEEVGKWARLEHACLLNVAEMDSQYLDVRDDMPASPAAVVTHMLQNLIYLQLYRCILLDHPHIGRAVSLRLVPGVLHFLCAVARSTFVCEERVIQYWPLITTFQTIAARIMLELWKTTSFENCRALLNLWIPDNPEDDLVQQVRDSTGQGPWPVEMIDGYSVFWTFRDVRSLSLEVYMNR